MKRYGDVSLDRVDIRGARCVSVDLRAETGAPAHDETREVAPGTFTLSVFAPRPGTLPIGEIRMMVRGVEVSLVGHATNRRNVVEVTPDHLTGCVEPSYRASILAWLTGTAASA